MSGAKYIVGIDLGTTNTVVAFAPVDARRRKTAPTPAVFEVDQLVTTTLRDSLSLLPSALYAPLPGEVDGDPEWLVGMLARTRNALAGAVNLRVQTVVIEGRNNTPEASLQTALGVRPGDPILGFSLQAARSRIEALSWVEHASIERRLPGTLVISVTERRPFAIWQNQGRFVLVGRDGQVVTNEEVASFRDLPLVVGVGAPQNAAALLDALAGQPALKARVLAAVRVGERRWNLRLKNGADVLLPEGAEGPALAKLMELQTTQALLDRPLSIVDMRLPDRLVVRPAPAFIQAPPAGKKV